MRKYLTIFLWVGILFCFPLFVYAKDDIAISSVEVDDVSAGTEEVVPVTYQHLNLSFKLSFTNVNDYIRYKITIKNDTSKDYILKDDGDGIQNSEYILYQVQFEDDSKVIKANTEKVLYVTARYMKEVDPESFVDGKFVEQKQVGINLTNEINTVNPNTGVRYLFLGMILIVSLIGVGVMISNHKYLKTFYSVLLFGLICIPIVTYAIEVLTLQINSEVEISYMKQFCYYNDRTQTTTYFEYEPGTIMSDYLAEHPELEPYIFRYNEGMISKDYLNEQLSILTNGEYTDLEDLSDSSTAYYELRASMNEEDRAKLENLRSLYFGGTTRNFVNNPILDKTYGCYSLITK